jgi:hypothetical protein
MNNVTLQEAKEAKQALVAAISAALSTFTDKTGLRVEAVNISCTLNISCTFPDIDYAAYGEMGAGPSLRMKMVEQGLIYDVDVSIPM